MAKTKTVYVCEDCGHETLKWEGRCPQCQAWDSFREKSDAPATSSPETESSSTSGPRRLSEVDGTAHRRTPTGASEIDQLLGGGVVPGSTTLIGGEPGIGKSTLLLQICGALAAEDNPALYVSAEESSSQIALRADRLRTDESNVTVLCETALDPIRESINKLSPPVTVIDSIQMIRSEELNSSPGSVRQVRECTGDLVRIAKNQNMPLFVVGHVTKDGSIAGPKTMEHMVDTVLYFDGDADQPTRMLRSVKNRFGSTNAVALMEMTEKGLRQVTNPAGYFTNTHDEDVPGWVSVPTRVGNRTLMLEVQALTSQASYGNPARRCTGMEQNRLSMILAVLKKRSGMALSDQDVYVNVAGGMSISEPAGDLPMALAIASSFRNRPLPEQTAAAGEVGLAGEIRPVKNISSRITEARKTGMKRLLVPESSRNETASPDNLDVLEVNALRDALQLV